jgi:UDP-N-acetylmuramate dehydrogenase
MMDPNWPKKPAFQDLRRLLRGRLVKDRSLKKYTTYRVGGPADLYFEPLDRDDLAALMRYVYEREIPFFVIGKGANLLVSDNGFRGVVVNLQKGLKELDIRDLAVTAGSGAVLWDFLYEMQRNSLGGLEKLIGIPGTIGGAIYMNAGAFGSEISDCLVSVDVMKHNGEPETLNKEQIPFGYRKGFAEPDKITLGIALRMKASDSVVLRSTMDEIWRRRKSTQPLSYPSAGSVFKRPPGKYAGVLIEQAGLKGTRVGGAVVSTKHANFILNKNHATAQDIYDLIRIIRDRVHRRFGVTLELENQLVGWDNVD